ncbi:Protein of unknown function (DUF2457) domain containing protein [Rhypophila decipiens]
MDRRIPRDQATTNVLAWTATQSANVEPSVEEDAAADTDEPPDCRFPQSPIQKHFTRAPVRRGSEQHESLLTKALQSYSDEESGSVRKQTCRRRSITSNISLASTADWTCETGITTPARTSSPSPRLLDTGFTPIQRNTTTVVNVTPANDSKEAPLPGDGQRAKDPAVQALEKKRCISFACAARPTAEPKPALPSPAKPAVDAAKAPEPVKRTTIKFACSQPPRATNPTASTNLEATTPVPRVSISTLVDEGTPRASKPRSPSSVRLRSVTPRRSSRSPVATRTKKYLTANPGDLRSETARFHEFASDELQEDDWIRRDDTSSKPKLTINDTLSKENAIRKLGKEAEEEAELEEEEADEEENEEDEDDDDDDDDGDNDEDIEDDDDDEAEDDEDAKSDVVSSRHGWNDEASDGYNTDNEVGFAESEDEDDDLVLWTTNFAMPLSLSGATPVCRRKSVDGESESSGCSRQNSRVRRTKKARAPILRPGTPELPDSTDFVCGTLDEDRPLEEAYISQLAARRREKLLAIPQDIDPSFPTSEPEDEGDELYKKGYGDSDDHLWLHGKLEDLHHERDRKGRRKKSDNQSPKRCRSPPPKRRHSPAPQARGRSDRRLFDRTSPRKARSPAPRPALSASPVVSPANVDGGIAFKALALRPGLGFTKSLPRAPVFHHLTKLKKTREEVETDGNDNHIRGAIDIVKGLEQKRQRRKEKYYQKYCNRARKEKAQAQIKRPVPGQGAQRMREVGLIMAGKIGQGNYVLSV